MELQPAISIQGWMIINLLLKRRISAQRWARWYSRSSELCPAPVWWITGVWAAAYVLQTFCDCMCLGRCITDTYPYHSLKFVYVFIGELVSKPDSLSCFLLLLEKRYEGQLKAKHWCVACGWNRAVSHKLSCKAVPIASWFLRSHSTEVYVWTNTACCRCGRGGQG